MRILVIESSPHKNGLSNLLADHFIRGAKTEKKMDRHRFYSFHFLAS